MELEKKIYQEAVNKVAENMGLSRKLVDRAYRSYWKATREYICSLPFKKGLSDEEFSALRSSVNIPSIGKLYVTLDRYRRIQENTRKSKERKQQEL